MIRRRLALLFLVIVGLAAAAFLVPLSAFRGPLEAAASRALGRDVTIGGPLHLAVYPQLGISLRDVAVANIAGGQAPRMIAVGKLVIGADPAALLAGRLRVTKVILKQPVIHLEVGRDGVGNWQSATAGDAPDPAAAVNLRIERVKIEGGEVTYADARSGLTEALSDVSLSLTTAPSATGGHKLNLDGSATCHAVPMTLASVLDDLPAFLKGAPSNAHIELGSDLFNASFTGRLDAPGAADGKLSLAAPSLRDLAGWGGQKLPPGNGLGAVAIDAVLSAKDGAYALTGATITLDGMKLAGDLSVDTRPALPALKGTLSVDHVDITPYLAPGTNRDVAAAPRADPNTPLALGGLRAIDGDVALTIGGVVLPDLKLDRVSLVAGVHAGVLTATLNSIAAYGGTGKGTLTVDATGALPGVRNVLDMNGVRTELLLNDLVGMPRIKAGGAVHLDVTGRGATEAAIVKSLGGKGSVSLGGGTIAGVDLGAVARLVQTTAGLLNGAVGDGAATSFTSLSASFAIQNGVAHTGDLHMVGPTVELSGAGTVNLSTRQIEFHLIPKARLGVAGINLVDLGVPFTATGTWDDPSFAAEPSALPRGIAGSVAGTAKDILNVPGSAIKSLFGK
jgi:AsmA protein